jgi:hypothetical protein
MGNIALQNHGSEREFSEKLCPEAILSKRYSPQNDLRGGGLINR